MIGRCLAAIVFLAGFFLVPAAPAVAQCLQYEPASVTLTGTVEVRQYYGPPNFGKTPARDQTMYHAILVLDRPLCVDGTPGATYNSKGETDVRAVQMVVADYPFGNQWQGKRVAVTGQLFHAFTAAHRTAVLIAVSAAHVSGKDRP